MPAPPLARRPRYGTDHCTVNVRVIEWLRVVEQEVHVPVTAREYVPTAVPELAGCGGAAPPPPQAASTSIATTSAPKAAIAMRPRFALVARLRTACARLPNAKNAIVQSNHGCGSGRRGRGLCRGKPEAAAMIRDTFRFAVLLMLVEAGETVQLAPAGAPEQAKATC